MTVNAFGPVEPPTFRALRDQYWAHNLWLRQLENRITRTNAGLAWLMRVKHIGYP